MIRSIRLGLAFCLSMASLALLPPASTSALAADASARRMELPAPDKTGGMPLMQALAQRRSTKSGFNGAPLPAQQLSDLLWAAWGVNREDGRRRFGAILKEMTTNQQFD